MVYTLNEITDHPPAAVGVHDGNEGIIHDPVTYDFIQTKHDRDYHGKDDDIKDSSTVNQTK